MSDVDLESAVELQLESGKTATIEGLTSTSGTECFRFSYRGKTGIAARKLFVTSDSDAKQELSKQGLVITSKPDWREIVSGIESIESFPPELVFEKVGWHDGHFVRTDGKIFSPRGSGRGRQALPSGVRRYPRSGTYMEWRDEVGGLLTGQTLPMIAAMCPFAAPLLAFAGIEDNFGFDFWGPGGKGKTTLQSLIASVSGDPGDFARFDATQVGIQSLFDSYEGSALPIDEASLADRKDKHFFKDMIFRLASGTLRINAYRQDLDRRRFVFITNGNRPYYEALEALDPDTVDAAKQRLIPLRVDGDLGVLNTLPEGFASSGDAIKELTARLKQYHGSALPRFMRRLVTVRSLDPGKFDAKLREDVKRFEREVGVASSVAGTSRVSSAFGLLAAAGELAQGFRALPPSWNCRQACREGYRNYLDQLQDHAPLHARLLAIAQHQQTVDLRNADKLPRLKDSELSRLRGFLAKGKGGRVELQLTPEYARQAFPDWRMIKSSADFEACILADKGRRTRQRKVRKGKGLERLVCFVLPPEIVEQLDN